jgi:class 3 adenylate cyclase/alpha-beta hydrolase superfamily lysophospholipase
MAVPSVRYARDGDLHIAYQVWGEGPIDLVLVWGLFSHCQLFWEDPPMARFLEELGTFARVVQFDKRGTGMSDAVSGIPTLEERMDDVRIVTDELGMDRVAILGESEGGPMSCLFSATFPDRVTQLVLYAPLMSWVAQDDFPEAIAPESAEAWVDMAAEHWGEGIVSELGMPSRVADATSRELCARFERFALSRGAFRQLMRANTQIDIRPVLPLVGVPTLVLHRDRDRLVDAAHGRYYAAHIDGAEFVELEGIDHYVGAGDWQAVARQVRRYLTGTAEAADHDVDRVLATVLFTDIVDSTATAARLGDRTWRQVLDEHDRVVADEVARARGRVVKTTGDGALAVFDGPARAVRCAQSVLRAVRGLGIEARAGVHTGEVEQRGDDVGGIAVHIGARVASAAGAGQLLVSRTVVDLVVGSGLEFADAGVHELKGVPGQWPLFAAA